MGVTFEEQIKLKRKQIYDFIVRGLKIRRLLLLVLFGLFLTSFMLRKSGETDVLVNLQFTAIKSPKGCLQYGIYKDAESFRKEKPWRVIRVAKSVLKDDKISSVLHLPPGTYGISVLDDENANGAMDFNLAGMPKEGFAFSNYFHSGLSRPVFQQFKFELRSNPLQLVCKFRYM